MVHNFFIFSYVKTIKHIKPDTVLSYTIKPNIYGGIASRINKVPYLVNITGLGTSAENPGFIQKITWTLYRIGLKKANCVFFQNESNRSFFKNKNIIINKTRLIPGSGVNIDQHKFEKYPEEDGIIKFLFIGRIMKAKGVDELLDAAMIIKNKYPNVLFNLVGPSEENYNEKLENLQKAGIIKYHGQQDDVHSFIKESHATILPSYHEGIANVLLESASAGRPVIASKIPGCQETFDEGISGLGFEVKNVNALINAIVKFIELPYKEKKKMGTAGRKKMEKEFNRQIVIDAYIEEINKLVWN